VKLMAGALILTLRMNLMMRYSIALELGWRVGSHSVNQCVGSVLANALVVCWWYVDRRVGWRVGGIGFLTFTQTPTTTLNSFPWIFQSARRIFCKHKVNFIFLDQSIIWLNWIFSRKCISKNICQLWCAKTMILFSSHFELSYCC